MNPRDFDKWHAAEGRRASKVLRNDGELIEAMERMVFEEDPRLSAPEAKADLIHYFEEAYGNTDQDTVAYAPEFVIVVRRILQGFRPRKLVYLTDFKGEAR